MNEEIMNEPFEGLCARVPRSVKKWLEEVAEKKFGKTKSGGAGVIARQILIDAYKKAHEM